MAESAVMPRYVGLAFDNDLSTADSIDALAEPEGGGYKVMYIVEHDSLDDVRDQMMLREADRDEAEYQRNVYEEEEREGSRCFCALLRDKTRSLDERWEDYYNDTFGRSVAILIVDRITGKTVYWSPGD